MGVEPPDGISALIGGTPGILLAPGPGRPGHRAKSLLMPPEGLSPHAGALLLTPASRTESECLVPALPVVVLL